MEAFSKTVLLLGLVLYVVGLLVVNGYLYTLGVSDFSVLKPRFIYTGSLVVSLVAISTLLPLVAWQITPLADRGRTISLPEVFTGSVMMRWLIAICLLLFPWIGYHEVIHSSWNAARLYVINTLVGAAIIWFVRFWSRPKYRWSGPILTMGSGEPVEHWLWPFAAGAMLIYGLIVCLMLFTDELYPLVPEEFGGGKPKQARLLFESSAVDGARQLGVPIPSAASLSEAVAVLYESGDSYVLRLPDGHIASINKKGISGVRHSIAI